VSAIKDYKNCISLDAKDNSIKADLEDCLQIQKNLDIIESCMKKGDYSDAITYINNLLQRCRNWQSVQFKQVECLAYMGNTEKAQ